MKYGIALMLVLSLFGCAHTGEAETEGIEAEMVETTAETESAEREHDIPEGDVLTISPECRKAYAGELLRIVADPGTGAPDYFNTMEQGEDLCFGLAYLDEDAEPELIVVNGFNGVIYRYTEQGMALFAEFAGVQPYSAYLPELYYAHSGNSFAVLSHASGYRGGENNYGLRCFEIADGQAVGAEPGMGYYRQEAKTTLFYGWLDETVSYRCGTEDVSREEFLKKQELLPQYDRKLTLVQITEENIEAALASDALSNETGDFQTLLADVVHKKETPEPLNRAGQAYYDLLTGYAAEHDPSAWQMNLHHITDDRYYDMVIFEEAESLMMHIYRYDDGAMIHGGSIPFYGTSAIVSGSDPVLYVSSEFPAEDGVYGTVYEYTYLNTVSKMITVFREQERLDGGIDYFVKEADTFIPLTEEEYSSLREQQGDFGAGTYGFSAGGYAYTEDVAYRMSRSGGFIG